MDFEWVIYTFSNGLHVVANCIFFRLRKMRSKQYTPAINNIGNKASPTGKSGLVSPIGGSVGLAAKVRPFGSNEAEGMKTASLTSLCILTNEPTPLGMAYSYTPPVEKERIVLSDVRTEIGATVDWGFVLKLLLKLLPKLVLTTKDDEWWLDDAVAVLERATELIGVYVAVDSNNFKNEKLRAKILLFYENEVLYSQISVSFWQNITFLMIFATIFKK